MAEKSKSENASDKEFQVKFVTKLENLSVADTPFTVPASVDSEGLTALVRELLDPEAAAPELDWLCLGEIVRASLQEHVDRRTDITAETVIELEYIEKKLPPEPQVRPKRGVIMKGKCIDCIAISPCSIASDFSPQKLLGTGSYEWHCLTGGDML